MKRWQHRGEVEDSEDDEDLAALSTSPSPERPHKRARADKSIEHTVNNGHEVEARPRPMLAEEDEDEIAWRPAPVAATYGRKGKLTRPTKKPRPSEVEAFAGRRLRSSLPASIHAAEERAVLAKIASISNPPARAEAATTTREHDTALHAARASSAGAPDMPSPFVTRPEAAVDPSTLDTASSSSKTPLDLPPSTPSLHEIAINTSLTSTLVSDDENCSKVRDEFAAVSRRASSTASSSLLSERDVSPPAYFETRDSAALTRRPTADTEQLNDDSVIREKVMVLGPSTSHRSLRARKEIQLHPYLIDKAKYQKQCKERGIKPPVSLRLQREQKRIRGVLPASWLKIDFRAQNPPKSPGQAARRRLSDVPSKRCTSQRGVAKRVARNRKSSVGAHDTAPMSEDDAESDVSVRHSRTWSPPLCLSPAANRLALAPSETVDDDSMEHDSVDAMLAGRRFRPRSSKPSMRQPRITDKLLKTTSQIDSALSDRKVRQQSGRDPRRSQERQARRARGPRRTVPRMSIVDANNSPSISTAAVPPFVRLALRQARHLPDEGRHSPSRKFIRLHTADETREATSTLNSWRAGTLAVQRKQREPRRSTQFQPHEAVPAFGSVTDDRATSDSNLHQGLEDATKTPASRGEALNVPQFEQKRVLNYASIRRAGRHHETSESGGPRVAQVESLQREFDEGRRALVFKHRMQCLTESVTERGRHAQPSDFQLARYFHRGRSEAGDDHVTPIRSEAASGASAARAILSGNGQVLPHRPRKRRANRLDLASLQHWQENEISLGPSDDDVDIQPLTDISKPVLLGLGAFGGHYAVDFDVKPLPPGNYFRPDGFIGSGDFHDAINIASHGLYAPRGQMNVHIGSDMTAWAAWNEDVAADFRRIPVFIASVLQDLQKHRASDQDSCFAASSRQNIEYLLRSTVRYCSNCLFFVDPVDRQACVDGLARFIMDLEEVVNERSAAGKMDASMSSSILQFQLVLAYQAIQLSNHRIVSTGSTQELEHTLLRLANSLRQFALTGSLQTLRDWYRDVQSSCLQGTAADCSAAATLVILNHIGRGYRPLKTLLTTANASLNTDITVMCNVDEMDRVWQYVFSILPALRIDARGCVEDDARSSRVGLEEDWTMVRALMNRTFELYENTSRVRGFTVNAYLRTLLHRCYRLISIWHWTRCDPLLYTVYDFFSKQSRMLLNNEETHGSFTVLEDLSTRPLLDVLPCDLSFHIFLKMLATALTAMRESGVYPDRKIGASIAYRMIPTHGRTYPKEKDMQQDDVDALRNHHDLLCTLYYASPPGYRPGVVILRNLVDHANWHRKACQINVKAWTMLTIFQSSTYEPVSELQPLAAWFCDMLRSTTTQYRLARSEAEHDFHRARGVGADITESFLHATIANNQVQIASTLVDALAGLKRAFAVATSIAGLQALVQPTGFWSVLELFDPSQRRLLGATSEALYAVQAALEAEGRLRRHAESQISSTDSQEFGDFSALEELDAPDDGYRRPTPTIANTLLAPMSSFLSNILGADSMPDDSLLESSVSIWVRLARDLVDDQQRTWLSYVDDYSPNSWMQMRDTRQKRMFTPFYMSRVVEQPNINEQVRQRILSSWLMSLVEREAMLRFQHVLTSALLHHLEEEPLLENLPFAKDVKSGRYIISLHEFRQRRLSLISSVLSNMRQNLAHLRHSAPSQFAEIKNAYAEILRQLMQTMKSNYQELQSYQSIDVADKNVQGAYVEFVQHVVSYLQQHTADFCQVDKFFTDSSAFPLPATDPTYVVGKLKGCALKLTESGPRTELAVFIQTVSERAAVDGQQQYLANQLVTAMCGDPEMGSSGAPILRLVLLTTIIPAYINSALGSACGWIIALPLLHACEVVAKEILYDVQVQDAATAAATAGTLTTVLRSISGQCDKALAWPAVSSKPASLRLLGTMFSVSRASLTSATCIQRHHVAGDELLSCMRDLYAQCNKLEGLLNDSMPVDTLGACPWPDTRDFAEKLVRDSMNHWYIADGRYYVRRGNTSKEVPVQLGSVAQERGRLLQVLTCFRTAYRACFDPRRRIRQQDEYCHYCDMSNLVI
ncbi:uncharacterized protein SEPMUDRAFT_160463 [Sphaerulina musiva SO2202]|uniref:Mus7/MMS22 family-domain-containing protein n=1 Tax=Sphaerulina musiva (strain SO2202) TaxID=692275 RepID=N1QIT1_SPHMS|nr:uncharacterized protein SEPMUDRAFT_160463 [Sphaerulina musiva SO2202]EMF17131.1 hypothetical protein SEPMUDRAFT_160463 [Sphaerulina musiva SO2202]